MSEKKREIMPNSIIIFENKKKTLDKHPDYTGKIYDENGKEFFCSLWAKQVQNGENAGDVYLSGSLTDAEVAREQARKRKEAKGEGQNEKLPEQKVVTESGSSLDDDLPF
jgi:hypothetical protein